MRHSNSLWEQFVTVGIHFTGEMLIEEEEQ